MLFILHFLSGVITNTFKLSLGAFSLTGLVNLATILLFMLVICHPVFLKRVVSKRHDYLLFIAVFVSSALPSLVANANLRSHVAFATTVGSLVAVFYLAQLYWSSRHDLDRTLSRALSTYFGFIAVSGLIHAYYVDFSVTMAAKLNHEFAFILFEFPHSAAIVSAALLPLYYKFILDGRLRRANFILVYAGLPVALIYSGTRIGVVVYCVSLVLTIIVSHFRSWSGLVGGILALLIMGLVVVKSPVSEQFDKILSVRMSTYLHDNSGYSINSLHTRTKVWRYMVNKVSAADQLYTGLGWRAWDLSYLPNTRFASSQSDYITVFFDTGLLGLVGFLLYRGFVMAALIRDSSKGSVEPLYLLCGVIGSLYIGGLTENVDGYSSTSWLLPVMLGLGHCYLDRARDQSGGDTVPAKNGCASRSWNAK